MTTLDVTTKFQLNSHSSDQISLSTTDQHPLHGLPIRSLPDLLTSIHWINPRNLLLTWILLCQLLFPLIIAIIVLFICGPNLRIHPHFVSSISATTLAQDVLWDEMSGNLRNNRMYRWIIICTFTLLPLFVLWPYTHSWSWSGGRPSASPSFYSILQWHATKYPLLLFQPTDTCSGGQAPRCNVELHKRTKSCGLVGGGRRRLWLLHISRIVKGERNMNCATKRQQDL